MSRILAKKLGRMVYISKSHIFAVALTNTFTDHMSVQSQLQTKNVQDIWHMPNYSLISWVPKTGKNKKIQRESFPGGPIKVFPL